MDDGALEIPEEDKSHDDRRVGAGPREEPDDFGELSFHIPGCLRTRVDGNEELG
jgi:hypothetical protein